MAKHDIRINYQITPIIKILLVNSSSGRKLARRPNFEFHWYTVLLRLAFVSHTSVPIYTPVHALSGLIIIALLHVINNVNHSAEILNYDFRKMNMIADLVLSMAWEYVKWGVRISTSEYIQPSISKFLNAGECHLFLFKRKVLGDLLLDVEMHKCRIVVVPVR